MSSLPSESTNDAATAERPVETSVQGRAPDPVPVVAIGTSAGGLAACTSFLEHVPTDTGLAFVIVQHLDPSHESHLVELLAKATSMPVVQITNGTDLIPNRVHVIPPAAVLTIAAGRLQLLPRESPRLPMPIDTFLRALAEDRREDAIAVILSGAGSDGSLGVEAVWDRGGFVLAQEPLDAAFDSMPRRAIATGCVDSVLPAAELGPMIARISRGSTLLRAPRPPHSDERPEDRALKGELIQRLRRATGIDFGQYRSSTVDRRLRRRVSLRGFPGLREYSDHVRDDPGELQSLARDLLIPVTRFFRDPEAFDSLAQTAFPDLIRRAAADPVVRIWVPGCSTGEEAYSIAMTFMETAQRMQSAVTCQVFATDVNDTLLKQARRATYPQHIEADVSRERLARFFTRTNDHFHVQRDIRDLCAFSRHDLLSDPPLSRMDLVSCRNLLIYVASGQRRALGALHFALEPGGYLLLGRSESVGAAPELFEAVGTDTGLFRARASVIGRRSARVGGARDARRRAPTVRLHDVPDLASAYEEIIAANEELQGLNEELESSKEEIEAANEELMTLNQELRSRNAALDVARGFSEATIDMVRSGLVVLDRDQVVVNANRSFYRMFHLDAPHAERRRLSEVVPAYFQSPAVVRLLQQLRTTDLVLEDVEVEFDLPGHGRRVMVMNALRFTPGEMYLLSIDDVTVTQQLAADRQQSQKMEAIGHLAAGVAHDFNNLLTVVLGGAQVALLDLPKESPIRPILERVGVAARRAADLTHQLLAYAGKSRAYVESVDLSDLVTQSANLLHASIPSHVKLRLDLERNLPRLLADRSQMHQVVVNLVTNAIEAVGDAAGGVLVRTGRQMVTPGEAPGPGPCDRLPPGEYVFLEVQDTGAGMTPQTQRQMFDPFFTTKFTGRGLGLAAVQGIVRQHRGTVLVTSVVGRGTAVRVLLAISQDPETTATTGGGPPLPRGTATILVVDDEPLVLGSTQLALESLGYRVVTATGGAEALRSLRSGSGIAAVVLDAVMPGMGGIATLNGIRDIDPHVPVLVCSGLGDVATEQAFADQGVAGFLHKPFTLHDLAARIAACCPGSLSPSAGSSAPDPGRRSASERGSAAP